MNGGNNPEDCVYLPHGGVARECPHRPDGRRSRESVLLGLGWPRGLSAPQTRLCRAPIPGGQATQRAVQRTLPIGRVLGSARVAAMHATFLMRRRPEFNDEINMIIV